MLMNRCMAALFAALMLFAQTSHAETWRLGVAPLLSPQEASQRYAPLLRYLSEQTGQQFELVTSRNFMAYWQKMLQPEAMHFQLDGSHLAAYRMDRRQHRLVARLDGLVSYTLIARADDLIIDPEELLNRRIAFLPSPNLSAILFSRIFDNPMRQPRPVPVANADAAMEAVRTGKADAAFVPTPFLQRYPEASVVLTTEQMPGMTVTAAPGVPEEVVSALRDALLRAHEDPKGQAALERLRFVQFIPADAAEYRGLGELLKGIWGY